MPRFLKYKFSTVLTFRLYIVYLLLVRSFFFHIEFSGPWLKRQYIFGLIFMLQLLRWLLHILSKTPEKKIKAESYIKNFGAL